MKPVVVSLGVLGLIASCHVARTPPRPAQSDAAAFTRDLDDLKIQVASLQQQLDRAKADFGQRLAAVVESARTSCQCPSDKSSANHAKVLIGATVTKASPTSEDASPVHLTDSTPSGASEASEAQVQAVRLEPDRTSR